MPWVVLMTGLLAALALFSALLLLLGCAAVTPEKINNLNLTHISDKITLVAPATLDSEVGVPFEYSFCNPKPNGKLGFCGGINDTTNPTGGKGPYTFYLGAGVGFPPFGTNLNPNGILAGTPTAAGIKTFQVCAKDIGGDFACQMVTMTTRPAKAVSLTGKWIGSVKEFLHGPEGSFPEGCNVEQTVEFDITQYGPIILGNTTTTLTKINGCDPIMPSSLIGAKASGDISGGGENNSISFHYADILDIAAADFNATISNGAMVGTVATCHSPDKSCTCYAPDPRCPGGVDANGNPLPGSHETINWWTGNFTATRVQ
jgi:hypothetical protein